MTPQELFALDPTYPQWIRGADVGVDQDDGLWVRANAELMPDLGSFSKSGIKRMLFMNSRGYFILTSDRKISAEVFERLEPAWKNVIELTTGSIGPDWIAVD